MKYLPSARKTKLAFAFSSIASILLTTQSGFSAPGDKVHAYFADEHNTTPTSSTGNRILEIDIENMTLVNTLNVPGNLGHHADNGFNSKIYGVPKGSGYVNSIDLRKDQNDTTSMSPPKKIPLIHKPRSGDAYNAKFNVILMTARNRPMGSFINVETDKVVGTIGENVDCQLTDGTMLLSHADANTIAGATKYQCVSSTHGGDQISGHPYWLTSDYAAVVDRTNKQISVYYVWQDGSKLKSRLVNHLPTRSSIHQIVPRDRTNLPASQKADFYAIEEGEHIGNMDRNGRGVTDADYAIGVSHALLHMKLTTTGLQLVKRMNLQRTRPRSKIVSDRILAACVANYRNTNNYRQGRSREQAYNDLFAKEGITRNPNQAVGNDFPVDCFYPGIPGGHNADFAPNNKHLYVPMAGGAMSIVDVNRWKIVNNLDIGVGAGPGHTCFSKKNNIAFVVNHARSFVRFLRNINSERPTIHGTSSLPFTKEGLINTYASHTCYIDEKEEYYYNFFTDGGVFYRYKIQDALNHRTGNLAQVDASIYTGGIPIQGSYIYLKNIKDNSVVEFKANSDTATSDGSAVEIDVLANDTGVNIALEYADGTSHGNVKVVNGKAVYTPNSGFSGTDGFWYGVSSPGVEWKWAYVTVTVNSTTPPTVLKALNDTADTSPGSSVTIDVLANDTGSNIVLSIVDTSWIGTVTQSGNSIVYQADPTFLGDVDFWYSVTDSAGNEEWAKVTVTVKRGGSLAANNDTATVKKGQSVLINVLANDTGSNISLGIVDSAWTGTASKSGNRMRYQATNDFTGDVVVWYSINDANGNEEWATVTITITN